MKSAEVKIGELADPSPGSYKIGPFGSALKKSELVKSGIAVAGIENVLPNTFVPTFRKFITPHKFVELADYQVKAGDILVTTMGTIGRAAVVPTNVDTTIIDSHLFRMRVDGSKVYPPYLCFAINGYSGIQQQLNRMARGAIMDGLNTTILKDCTVPLPTLDEQKRIAALLDKADRLRRSRRYAQELSDGFLQSVFLEMFQTKESHRWTFETIEDLAKEGQNSIRTGPFGSQLLHSEFTKDGIAVLGIDNAVRNRFAWDKRRFISEEKYDQLKRYTVFPGDVLITIMGTCGRCAVVPDNIPLAINTKHLCCITLNQRKCLPAYLQACFLMHPLVLGQLGISERGAVMPGLNLSIIKDLAIPLPPIALQEKFVHAVRRVDRLRVQQAEADRQAEHLFQTLLHRAFSN